MNYSKCETVWMANYRQLSLNVHVNEFRGYQENYIEASVSWQFALGFMGCSNLLISLIMSISLLSHFMKYYYVTIINNKNKKSLFYCDVQKQPT